MSSETPVKETPVNETQVNSLRYVGQVKWFNNRAGYGFITMTDESGTEKDVFAHYTTIKMEQTQYKYLVQGEYVEFELSSSTNDGHEYQATNVTGIKNGALMCETRQQNRTQSIRQGPPRPQYRKYNGPRRDSRPRREQDSQDEEGYEKVQKRRSKQI